MQHFTHLSSFLLILCAIGAAFTSACASSSRPNMKSLVSEVEAYHRDLLFDRYDVAAKRIAPTSRMEWLSAVQSQGIRFAEIHVQSTEDCTEIPSNPETPDDDPIPCVKVFSNIQWYSNNSPVIKTTPTISTWNFDKESKMWIIVEQNQM